MGILTSSPFLIKWRSPSDNNTEKKNQNISALGDLLRINKDLFDASWIHYEFFSLSWMKWGTRTGAEVMCNAGSKNKQ